MKRVLFFLIMLTVLSVNSNAQDQPYKVENKNVSIGNNMYAQKVLSAWKDYDNNTLDNSASLLADSIVATFPDGTMIKGKDNFMKFLKDYRGSLTSATSIVHACTALKSADLPDHQVVSIWGAETDVTKDGTTVKTQLNELWFFNKEGKVIEFHQLAAKDMSEKK